MQNSTIRTAARLGALGVAAAALLCAGSAAADEVPDEMAVESPAASWLRTFRPDPELQTFLEERIKSLENALRGQTVRVALIDIPTEGAPGQAAWNGDSPVYPASVAKFVYLMAAYHWRDQGRLEIDGSFDRQLGQMIYASSNRATQKVVAKLTDTEQGPPLEAEEYAEFVRKRHAVKDWLRQLGITDLHMVHPTYDGGRDLYGRDEQFLEDTQIEGCLPDQTGQYRNRMAMTANGSAELLALLATDRALSPETSAEVRERMRRSTRKQAYLKYRIAGGAERSGTKGIEVFAKTGTWGPIHADAGIIRAPSGRQLVVAAFLEGIPRFRGSFIAEIAEGAARIVFARDGGV